MYAFQNTRFIIIIQIENRLEIKCIAAGLLAMCRCFDGNSGIRGWVNEEEDEEEEEVVVLLLFGVCTFAHRICTACTYNTYHIQNQMKNHFVEHWHDVCVRASACIWLFVTL